MQSINQNYPSIVEEIFEQARFRVGRTVRLRKEAIDFYQQKHLNSVNFSGDELLVDQEKERLSLSQAPAISKKISEEINSSWAVPPDAHEPEQSPLNLRQIDELSESDSNSSEHSTNNSRFLMKSSARENQHAEEEKDENNSHSFALGQDETSKRKRSHKDTAKKPPRNSKEVFSSGADLMMAMERNISEMA